VFGSLYLCASTIDDADLDTRLEAAVHGGYAGIGLRPGHVRKAVAAGTSIPAIRAKLADHDLELVEIGFLADWWETGERAEPSRAHEESLYRLRDALGGRHMMLIGGPLDRPLDEVAERFALVCDRASDHELRVALESLPWTDTDSVARAWSIVERSGRANGGVVMDTWHHIRGSGVDDDLDRVPPDRFVTIQLSDGPRARIAGELDDTFRRRLLPGDGEFDLRTLLGRLAALGVTAPVGVEVLSDELRALDAREVASRAADATRALLASLPGDPAVAPL
jgi:sugar phosphate isomerase/epimerase